VAAIFAICPCDIEAHPARSRALIHDSHVHPVARSTAAEEIPPSLRPGPYVADTFFRAAGFFATLARGDVF
jgi:hypothetical protein